MNVDFSKRKRKPIFPKVKQVLKCSTGSLPEHPGFGMFTQYAPFHLLIVIVFIAKTSSVSAFNARIEARVMIFCSSLKT